MTKSKRTVTKIEGDVKQFGSSSHIILPIEWIGKTVVVKEK